MHCSYMCISYFFLLTVPLAVALYKTGVFSNEPSVSTKIKVYGGAPVLKIVGDIDFKPMSYLKSDGSYAGSDIEAAIEIANRLGMKPFLKPYLDSSNCADRQMKNIIRNSISDALTEPDTLLKQMQMNCAKNCVKILSFFLLIRTV